MSRRWTDEEDNKLFEYRKNGLTSSEIHEKLPNRSQRAIICRIQKLKINDFFPFNDNKFIDLEGKKFGRLTVVERIENDKTGHIRWKCNCDCGNKNVIVYGHALKSRTQVSCGCYRNENLQSLKNKKIKTNSYYIENGCGVGICSNTLSEFYFDINDYNKIKNYCWMEDTNGYIVTFSKRKCIYLHRLIMNVDDHKKEIDHIKHNTKDNRKCMLRVVSHSENQKNNQLASNNTSGFTGVFYDKRDGFWYARITNNNTVINLCRCRNKDDAIKARKEAEELYFGEYSFENSMNYNPETDSYE